MHLEGDTGVCFLNNKLRAARHSRVLERGSVTLHVKPCICATHFRRLGMQPAAADTYETIIYYFRSPTRHRARTIINRQPGKRTMRCLVDLGSL